LISVDNGSTASYVYGPEGRRVHEDVGGVVKEFVYGAGGQELTVVNASQGLIAGETYLGGRYLGTQTPSAFVWAASDELGTVRVRTNASGAPIETDTSWPFGAYLNNVGSVSNLHFTGKYRDGSSGLDYFGARYYDASLGRFLTPDWSATPEATPYASLANPQSLNPYAYVLNNPTTATDPDGHWCVFGHFGTSCSKAKAAPVKEGGPDDSLSGTLKITLLGMRDAATGRIPANASAQERNAASAAGMAMMVSGVGEGEEVEAGVKEIRELLEGVVDEGGSASRIVAKSGGIQQATKDFEALPGQAAEKSRSVLVKQLPDGSKAILRGSSDGRETIEIQHANGEVTKIRYTRGGGE
ncbi:MAG: RHS repeat-associated core domain-containing protein, partial [Acidobacteria bacterium]